MKRYYLELEKIDRRVVTLAAVSEDSARAIAEDGGGDLERDDEEGLWICRHCEVIEDEEQPAQTCAEEG